MPIFGANNKLNNQPSESLRNSKTIDDANFEAVN